jgi:uncharacterized FlaG/YvyC family protein
MAINRHHTVDEFLIRWAPDGSIKGMHVAYITRIIDDETGEVIAERPGHALSVGAPPARVPLNTALGEVRAAVVRAAELAQQAQAEAEAARDAAIAERDEERRLREAAERRLEELESAVVEQG